MDLNEREATTQQNVRRINQSIQFTSKQADILYLPAFQIRDMQPRPLQRSSEQMFGYNPHPSDEQNVFGEDISMENPVRARALVKSITVTNNLSYILNQEVPDNLNSHSVCTIADSMTPFIPFEY